MTRRYVVAIMLLLAGGVATEAASRFIVARFPDRPLLPDLLLGVLPHVPEARYVTSAAITVAFLLFAFYAFGHARSQIPAFIAMIAIMYLLRAALLVLTPFANANNGAPAAFPLFQYGMFPSGHTAAVFLLARFTDAKTAPAVRRAECVLAAIVVLGLLLSRSHYSIDIAGGALLAYFVEREWTDGHLFDPLQRLVDAGA
ncbi:MAG: hypothetical protein WBI91_04600 [Coriobacteriia bacterium]